MLTIAEPDRKFFIKSIQQKDLIIDWYFYSRITSFSAAIIAAERENEVYQIVQDGYGITDITLTGNLLTIQTTDKPLLKIDHDSVKLLGLNIKIDSTGNAQNESSTRFGRLQNKNVDYSKRHFTDSDGTNFGN